MSNDRLYIRCTCDKPPEMLAKIWGGRIGADTEVWRKATENLALFFKTHSGCPVEDFSLCFELEAVNITPTPSAAESAPPTPSAHPGR